jgi:DNA-binding NarL/FixJ family response regulator
MPSIVIVEDDALISLMLEDCCTANGIDVVGTAINAAEAVPMILEKRPSFLVLDYRLPGGKTGLDILHEVRAEIGDAKVVFITGSTEPETIAAIREAEPDGVLTKPILEDALLDLLGV